MGTADRNDETRTSTGVPGLDEILHGGLLPKRSYLVVGGAGSGKTLLSLQFMLAVSSPKDRAMYVTLAEPEADIRRNVEALGWNLDKVDFVDLSPREQPTGQGDYHVFAPSEVEQSRVWKGLIDAIEDKRPTRLVIDSVTQLGYLSTDEYQFRKQILALVAYLGRNGCTSYLLHEPSLLDREASVGLAVDGIIRVGRTISPGLAIGLRSVQIDKLRGSDFLSGLHPLMISADGITVFPHRVESLGEHRLGERQIGSGIAALDELLGGGLESGTTALFSGPAGAGKTTLGLSFLCEAARAGGRSVVYTFEESVESIASRCESIGIPARALLANGKLRIERVNPLQLYPDQFLAMIRNAVEQQGCTSVMVDSLRGYELAMEEFGQAKAHIHNLVTYLNRKGVTTLLISEVEHITSTELRATDLGVSHLADSIVLMRYAEHAGQVIKIINCLKKRNSDFQPELRQFSITAKGIQVSEKLQHLRGILTGVPTLEQGLK